MRLAGTSGRGWRALPGSWGWPGNPQRLSEAGSGIVPVQGVREAEVIPGGVDYNGLVLGWAELARLAREGVGATGQLLRVHGRNVWSGEAKLTMAANAQRERLGPDEQVVELVVQRVVAAFRALRVILFGSRARGEAGRWSDVDLLVVLPEVADKRLAAVEMLRAVGDLPVATDIVVSTPQELAHRGQTKGSVLRAALREGKVVYESAR